MQPLIKDKLVEQMVSANMGTKEKNYFKTVKKLYEILK